MDIHQAAKALDGMGFGDERGFDAHFREMEAAGLVAVFGASDDDIFVMGAIRGRLRGHGPVYLYEEGLLQSDENDDSCPYFEGIKKRATEISADFRENPSGDHPSWTFECPIEHTTFETQFMDFDAPYSRGIVLRASDIQGFQKNHSRTT